MQANAYTHARSWVAYTGLHIDCANKWQHQQPADKLACEAISRCSDIDKRRPVVVNILVTTTTATTTTVQQQQCNQKACRSWLAKTTANEAILSRFPAMQRKPPLNCYENAKHNKQQKNGKTRREEQQNKQW